MTAPTLPTPESTTPETTASPSTTPVLVPTTPSPVTTPVSPMTPSPVSTTASPTPLVSTTGAPTQPTEAPTAPPTAQPLNELLASVSFDGGEALQTPFTPQNMAYKWLANNTFLDTYTSQQKIQHYSLATLYFSTNGNGSTDDGDECGVWKVTGGGLQCKGDVELVEFDLGKNNLVGTIPPEVGLLSNLLVHLFLWDNVLSGSIPCEVGYLTTIRQLWADFNGLSGSIPSELGRLDAMAYLDLESNILSGSIPSEVGFLTSMRTLYLDTNQLTGTIPPAINKMTNLEELLFYYIEFTGSFVCPDFIGSCWISCNPWETDWDDRNGTCRSL